MISNYELFHPKSTGAPRQDVYNHVARLPQPARIDFEEHTLAGNLILRIEAGLGGETEQEATAKSSRCATPRAFSATLRTRWNLSVASN